MRTVSCAVCGMQFNAKSARAKYCSKVCSWQARKIRDGLQCQNCGKYIWKHKTSATEGARCRDCINGGVGYFVGADGRRWSHGASAYRNGCRCEICKSAQAVKIREFTARFKDREGYSYSTFANARHLERHGVPRVRSAWISRKDRLAIYERDEWICQLCGEIVDKDADFNDDFAPSLDHIIPQSHHLIPDDSPRNLQLAHRVCNSRKQANIDYLKEVS